MGAKLQEPSVAADHSSALGTNEEACPGIQELLQEAQLPSGSPIQTREGLV